MKSEEKARMFVYLYIFDQLFWFTKTKGVIMNYTNYTKLILVVYKSPVFSKPTSRLSTNILKIVS